MLTQVAPQPLRGGEAMGFRELLYFRVVGCLGEQAVRLTPEQKREIFVVFGRRRAVEHGSLEGEPGAALPVSLASAPPKVWWSTILRSARGSLYSAAGTRIPVAVVVEQLRAGVARIELEEDFPQLSRTALDYAEIQARMPKPPGPPRKALRLQRG